MEDDDEFGDLYTDVLRPLATSFQSHSQQLSATPPHTEQKEIAKSGASSTSFQKRPIDLNLNSDDDDGGDDGFYAAPNLNVNSNSAPQNQTLASVRPVFNFRPAPKDFDLNKDSGPEVENFVGLAGVVSDLQARVLEKKSGDGKFSERAAFGGSSFMDEPDIDVVVEERDDKDDDFVVKDDNLVGKTEKVDNFVTGTGNVENFGMEGGESKTGEMGSDPIIPGVSIPGVSAGADSLANANFEDDWDSDSEDDLQIVLNDNNHGPMGMGGEEDDEDDEDGDPLVIVADNDNQNRQPMMIDEQEWGGEEVGPSGDGDRKELGDAAKVNGVGVVAAPKIGYNSHVYHHPFHSQFKYVRPGAAPTGPGGAQGQVRPPGGMVPGIGRGRGDWRPTGMKGTPGMQKGFHSGYAVPVWGNGASGRGLDFTLPSHKTIFEVDIDSFEEKPWKLPGVDITDFFNFGLNEENWNGYCKQLEQLRLETTMQSKIRVYESGRTEQDYDPDLPPELAAAAGIQEIPSENAKLRKTDAGQNDLGKGPALVRPALPTGRPIQVETGYGERLPSIDTRKPRISDLDVIIEIVCQDSTEDESSLGNDVAGQQDNDLPSQDLREGDEFEDLPRKDTEHNHFPNSFNNEKEVVAKRLPLSNPVADNTNEGGETVRLSSEYRPDSSREQPAYPARIFSGSHEERRSKVRAPGRAREKSPALTNKEHPRDEGSNGYKKEESIESIGVEQSSAHLSQLAVGGSAEQEVGSQDAMSDDENVHSDRDSYADKEEESLNATANDETVKDETAKHTLKKHKLIQVTEALSQEIDDGEDSRTARSSENSKARSGSSKDFRKLHDGIEDEVHDGRSTRMANVKGSVGGNEDIIRRKGRDERQASERQRTYVKGREDSHPPKSWDPYSGSHSQAKYESIDRRKESENAEVLQQRRDGDLHGRRSRVEDTRKKEQFDETGSRQRSRIREIERIEKDEHQLRKQLDKGSWRGSYDKDPGSRHRDRDDIPKSRNVSVDDVHSKRRKEEAHSRREHVVKEEIFHSHREDSGRQKRERDDVYDQRRRDDQARLRDTQARLRDDDQHNVRLKEDELFQRERNERLREREEWHRLKQSNEEISAKKDREETRVGMRSARAMEDKAWGSQSRGKDEHRSTDKEYHSKDAARQNELFKRRDRVDSESLSQHRGREDAVARGNQLNNDEKRARHERASTHDDCAANASDNYKVQEKKHKEYPRKAKESEAVDRNSIALSKRNQEENRGQISDMGNLKGRLDQRSENEILVNNPPSRKRDRKEGSSDDEQQESRKGRSKLERWASHKERDFSVGTKPSASMKTKQIDTHSNVGPKVTSKLPDPPSNKVEDKQHASGTGKECGGSKINNSDKKPIDDRHLDTVEKLKKRCERFKLPMPGEKEGTSTKKTENKPLPPAQSENRADSEIKAERPPRKRRWTSN